LQQSEALRNALIAGSLVGITEGNPRWAEPEKRKLQQSEALRNAIE